VTDPYAPPEAWLQDPEKRELLRLTAVKSLRENRRALPPEALAWAELWAAEPPLAQPMTTGEPMPGLEHLP
jgi:hypothetical protein